METPDQPRGGRERVIGKAAVKLCGHVAWKKGKDFAPHLVRAEVLGSGVKAACVQVCEECMSEGRVRSQGATNRVSDSHDSLCDPPAGKRHLAQWRPSS